MKKLRVKPGDIITGEKWDEIRSYIKKEQKRIIDKAFFKYPELYNEAEKELGKYALEREFAFIAQAVSKVLTVGTENDRI